jgi:hypothetical protein
VRVRTKKPTATLQQEEKRHIATALADRIKRSSNQAKYYILKIMEIEGSSGTADCMEEDMYIYRTAEERNIIKALQ